MVSCHSHKFGDDIYSALAHVFPVRLMLPLSLFSCSLVHAFAGGRAPPLGRLWLGLCVRPSRTRYPLPTVNPCSFNTMHLPPCRTTGAGVPVRLSAVRAARYLRPIPRWVSAGHFCVLGGMGGEGGTLSHTLLPPSTCTTHRLLAPYAVSDTHTSTGWARLFTVSVDGSYRSTTPPRGGMPLRP